MASLNHRRLLSERKKASSCQSSCADDVDNCPCTSPPPPDEYQPLQGPHGKQGVPAFAIIMVAILGACFLLVCYYAIIIKLCSFWKRSHRHTPQTEEVNSSFQDFLDEDHGPVLDHPIWYINTVGLEQSIIDSMSMLKYKKGDGLVEGNDCLVCLSEFEEDESLRLLPKCSHAFHLPCIDTWLRSHTNCPLCRAPIVSTTTESTSSGLNTSGAREEPQMESSVREEGEVSETNGDTVEHDRRRDMEISIENTLSHLGDKYSEIQPMRRSVSMDLSPRLALANSLLAEAEGSFRVDRGKKSKGRSSQEFPVGVKRSFSSGSKILLPRHSRNHSSILPLRDSFNFAREVMTPPYAWKK